MSAISGTAPTAPAADTYPGFRVLDPPLGLCGPVVAGYGRGSKELGVPTANLDPEALGSALDGLSTGIYCGWASIEGSEPYMAVMSIGFNPFYKREKMSIEPHICHTFSEPFYGKNMKLLVVAFLRPELNFDSLDALIAAIKSDIEYSKARLGDADGPLLGLKSHSLFAPPE